jgi:hypothetical protein
MTGAMLTEHSTFDVTNLGDEAVGFLDAFKFTPRNSSEVTLYATTVYFRRGPIVGSVAQARFDKNDVKEQTTTAAHKLDERISGALASAR